MFPRRKGLLLRRLMKLQSRKTEKEKTDDDVIISRILMPVREAREYAERETVSGNGVERNYVIESWERIGHYRRLPHSEEKIYIEATCTRHKQLTDKDIVIRL